MEKEVECLRDRIRRISSAFLEKTNQKEILIISHFDTDGITSAAIMAKTLKLLDKKFSLRIVKSLDEKFIYELPKDKFVLFLDLASNSLDYLTKAGIKDILIIDHHEVTQKVPEEFLFINPQINSKEKLSSAGLTFFFCKEINPNCKNLAKLAILGLIGDTIDKDADESIKEIISDGEIQKRRGLLIYPSTRPLNKTLEFCSNPFIPGVTGDSKGTSELLREAGIGFGKNGYKSILELNEEEMSKLVTAIILRNPKAKNNEIVGDIYLIKLFNKLEDARDLSARINACSRLGRADIALQLCLEIPQSKKKAESIYVKYKQHLIEGLRIISEKEKIQGNGFVIINAEREIKDTIIGTVTSILQNSSIYEPGTIITAMAHYEDKIKISARIVGKKGRNARELLANVIEKIGGEVGGHESAAGGIIHKEKEKEFIDNLRKTLEIELIKL